MNKKVVQRGLLPYAFLLLFFGFIIIFSNLADTKIHNITYGEFMKHSKAQEVKEINITPNSSASVYTINGKLKNYNEKESFSFNMPLTDETMVKVLEAQNKGEFKLITKSDPNGNRILIFILNLLPTILLVGVFIYFLTKQLGGNNKSMDFGRSKARLSGGNTKITFKDVAGLDEEKEEMSELIDWYNSLKQITIKEIIEFHYRFESIHPFQDGNGRIGRIILFKECLKNNIVPFIIQDADKLFYYRGLKEYKSEKGYLIDTCLNAQDQYVKLVEYYLK